MRMGTSAGSYSRNGAAGMMGKCTVATRIREMAPSIPRAVSFLTFCFLFTAVDFTTFSMMLFLQFRLFRLPPIFVTNFFSFGKRKSLKIFRLNKQNKGRAFSQPREKTPNFYSSPIQTILSVSESHRILRQSARRLYCRSGISPCPEEFHISFTSSLYQL